MVCDDIKKWSCSPFADFLELLSANSHVLRAHPSGLVQQALNSRDDSAARLSALALTHATTNRCSPELQFFDLSQRLASARSYANSYSSLDFDTARQTVLAADRTTVLASAAVLLLTWYVMISNTASTTTLRRAASVFS